MWSPKLCTPPRLSQKGAGFQGGMGALEALPQLGLAPTARQPSGVPCPPPWTQVCCPPAMGIPCHMGHPYLPIFNFIPRQLPSWQADPRWWFWASRPQHSRGPGRGKSPGAWGLGTQWPHHKQNILLTSRAFFFFKVHMPFAFYFLVCLGKF